MMMPGILLVEADHDMRNPADFLVLNKLAKGVLAVPGISTSAGHYPAGGHPDRSTRRIPYLLSTQNAVQAANSAVPEERMDDLLKQADEMAKTINDMQRMYALMQQLSTATHRTVGDTRDISAITDELRDHIADFEDFLAADPQLLLLGKALLRYSYLLVAQIAYSIRSTVLTRLARSCTIWWRPRSFRCAHATDARPASADDRDHAGHAGAVADHAQHAWPGLGPDGRANGNAARHGQGFRRLEERRFFLPAAGGFREPRLQARHEHIPVTGREGRPHVSSRNGAIPHRLEGIARVDAIKTAAEEALKGTPLEDAKIYLAGTRGDLEGHGPTAPDMIS